MKGKELVEAYPKAASLAKDWLINNIKLIQKERDDVPDEFVTSMIGIVDDTLIRYIDNNPHSLFEMFDDSSIHISIIVRSLKDEKVSFNYRIIPRDKKDASRSSDDRKTIERYAVEDAFELLNNML